MQTHMVKNVRTNSIVVVASADICRKRALELNERYQTDEYRVELFRL